MGTEMNTERTNQENGSTAIQSTQPLVSLELQSSDQKLADDSSTASSSAWLAEVCEMRGRVCYDGGHRPSFQKADGSFNDFDLVDLCAYHVVARSGDRVVGCARVVPLEKIRSGVVSSFIGEERFASLLRGMGMSRERVCEASRWVVLPEFRGELGRRLVAAIWAVTRWLLMEGVFVMAGTRQKQDLALIRMGARPVSEVQLAPSQVFDDELRLLFFDVLQPPESMRRRIDSAGVALRLPRLVSPVARDSSYPLNRR
jgi:hypothetical protein